MSESEYEPTHSAVWDELQARLQTVWDERDALYNPAFEEVFAVMDDATRQALNTVGWDADAPLPVELDVATVSKALKQAGKNSDTAFCNDFGKYCNLTLKGKRLQREMVYLNVRELIAARTVEPQRAGAWVFGSLHVIDSIGMHGVVADGPHDMATHSTCSLLKAHRYMPLEDESEDDFIGCGKCEWKASLLPYLDELKTAGVLARTDEDALISGKLKPGFLYVLKTLVTYIEKHAGRPAAIKNTITRGMQALGSETWSGIILQILTLQGLNRWVEGVNINAGEDGYAELQSLDEWLGEALAWRVLEFHASGGVWSAADLKRLQPLGDYLCNTTVGATVQQLMMYFQGGGKAATSAPSTALPPELNNDEAKEILARARALELISESEGKLHWQGSQRLLAYFSRKMSQRLQLGAGGRIAWQPFEELFDVEAGTLRGIDRDLKRDGVKPKGWQQVDACME